MLPLSKSMLSRFSSLKQKKYRDQQNLYSISGFNAVKMAVIAKNLNIGALLVRQDQIEPARQIQNLIKKNNTIPVYKLSRKEFSQLSDEQSPQGIAIIVKKPDTQIQPDKITENSIIYLDNINDPGNLGTIIRTAAWFDIRTIMLSPNSADPFQPKTTRASAGMICYVKIYENVGIPDLNLLKNNFKYKLIGATVSAKISLENYKFDNFIKCILIFGSEAKGIRPEIEELLDNKISIPAYGPGESLNLAASTAIFLFSYKQQITLKAVNK